MNIGDTFAFFHVDGTFSHAKDSFIKVHRSVLMILAVSFSRRTEIPSAPWALPSSKEFSIFLISLGVVCISQSFKSVFKSKGGSKWPIVSARVCSLLKNSVKARALSVEVVS